MFRGTLIAAAMALMTAFVAEASAQSHQWAVPAPPEITADSSVAAKRVLFAQDAAAAGTLDGLETFLDGAVSALMTVHSIPGITISVVHGGEIILAKGYGFADVARTRPVDPDTTLFRPGSISKTFTWTAVMQLVEQGKLDLDADVNDYLTQFQIPEAFDAPVTLRHILSHTAGFEDGGVGYLFHRDADDLSPLAEALKAHMPARVRMPGTYASYSNWATALAGLIVANRSGMDFDSYVEQNIFTPLGMTHSTFREPVPDSIIDTQSANFLRQAGDYIDGGFEYIHDYGPAGGLSSTASDMARFMIAHLNDGSHGGGRILRPETARRMREPLHRHHEAVNAMLYGFYEQTHNGRFGYGHGGDTVHFHSEMALLPEENFGIFISTNAPAGAAAARQFIAAFFDKFFPSETDDPHPAPENPDEPDAAAMKALGEYAGAYRMNRRSYTTWEKAFALAGDLIVAPAPRGGLVLGGNQRFVEESKDVFRSVDNPDTKIVFGRNEGGAVSHLFIKDFAPIAGDRVGPLDQAVNHQLILGIGLFVMICLIAGTIWGLPKWLKMPWGAKFARLAVFGAAVLNVVFVGSLFTGIMNAGNEFIFTGIPNIGTLLMLPLIAAVLAVFAAVMVIPAWANGYWSVFGRLRYMVIVILMLTFAWSMYYWNLLGPWYA